MIADFDVDPAPAGNITSTREPNLISPTRSPRQHGSPVFLVKTMRRASNPAICLKTTVPALATHGNDVLLVLLG